MDTSVFFCTSSSTIVLSSIICSGDACATACSAGNPMFIAILVLLVIGSCASTCTEEVFIYEVNLPCARVVNVLQRRSSLLLVSESFAELQ